MKSRGMDSEFSMPNSTAERADAAIRRAQMDDEEEEQKFDDGEFKKGMPTVSDQIDDEEDDDDDISSNSGDDETDTKVFYTQKDLIVSCSTHAALIYLLPIVCFSIDPRSTWTTG